MATRTTSSCNPYYYVDPGVPAEGPIFTTHGRVILPVWSHRKPAALLPLGIRKNPQIQNKIPEITRLAYHPGPGLSLRPQNQQSWSIDQSQENQNHHRSGLRGPAVAFRHKG